MEVWYGPFDQDTGQRRVTAVNTNRYMCGRGFHREWSPSWRGGYPEMKKTARKHPWTRRPEVRDLIDRHENTQLDDRYHQSSDQRHYTSRDEYHHRGRWKEDFRQRGRGDHRRYWDERNSSQSGNQKERSRSRDYHYKKTEHDYDRNRSHSRNRYDRHRDYSHFERNDRSRSNSGTDSNRSKSVSSVSSINKSRLKIQDSDSESQGSPVRSWRFERKDSKNSVDAKNKISEVETDTNVQQSDTDSLPVSESQDDEIMSMSSEEMRKDGTSPYTDGEVPVTVSIEINGCSENKENLKNDFRENNGNKIEREICVLDGEEHSKTSEKVVDSVNNTCAASQTYDPLTMLKDRLKETKNITVSSEDASKLTENSIAESKASENTTVNSKTTQPQVYDFVGKILTDKNYAVKSDENLPISTANEPFECVEKNQNIVKGIHRNIVNMQLAAPMHSRQGTSKPTSLFQGENHSSGDILKKFRRSSGGDSITPETKKDEANNHKGIKQAMQKQARNNIEREVTNKVVEESSAQKQVSECAKEPQKTVNDKPEEFVVNENVNKGRHETKKFCPVENKVTEPADNNLLMNKEDGKTNTKHDCDKPNSARSIVKKRTSTDTCYVGKNKSLCKTAALEPKTKCNRQVDLDRQNETNIKDSSTQGKNVGHEMNAFDIVGQILNDSELNKKRKSPKTSAPEKIKENKNSFLKEQSDTNKDKMELDRNKNIFEQLGDLKLDKKKDEKWKESSTGTNSKKRHKSCNYETLKQGIENGTHSLLDKTSSYSHHAEKVTGDTNDNSILNFQKEKVKDGLHNTDKNDYKKKYGSGKNDTMIEKECKKGVKETNKTIVEKELAEHTGRNSTLNDEILSKLPCVDADKKHILKGHSFCDNSKTTKKEHREVSEETNKNNLAKEIAEAQVLRSNTILKSQTTLNVPAVNPDKKDCTKKSSYGEDNKTTKSKHRDVVEETNKKNPKKEMVGDKSLLRNSVLKKKTNLKLQEVNADKKDCIENHTSKENSKTLKNENGKVVEGTNKNNPEVEMEGTKTRDRISENHEMNKSKLKNVLHSLEVEEDDFEPIEIQPCPTPMLPNKGAYNPNLSDISDEESDNINKRKFANTIKYTDDTVLIERKELDNKRKHSTDITIQAKKQKLDSHHTPHKSDSIKDGRKLLYTTDSPRKSNYGERLKIALKGIDENSSESHEKTTKGNQSNSPAKSFLKKAKKKIKIPKPVNKQLQESEISKRPINEIHLETYLQDKIDNVAFTREPESIFEEQTESVDVNESKPSSPVRQNGFVITYKLILKDSRQVTTIGHLDPTTMTVKCDICLKYLSPLGFSKHHDTDKIIEEIDLEKCSSERFEPKNRDIILWNEEAQKVWDDFLKQFEKEQRYERVTTGSQVELATQDDIHVGNIKREKLRAKAFPGTGLVSSPKPVTAENSVNRETSEIPKHDEIQTTLSASKHTETQTVDLGAGKNDTVAVSTDSKQTTESQVHQNDKQKPCCSNAPDLKPESPSSLFLFNQQTSALDASLFSETELLVELKKKFGCEHEDSDYGDMLLGLKLQNRSIRRMLKRKQQIGSRKELDTQIKIMQELNRKKKHIQANMERSITLEKMAKK